MEQDSGVMSGEAPPAAVVTLDELTRSGVGGRGLRLVDGRRRLDADEVDRVVSSLAGSLVDAGVGRGDVVAWQLPNGVETVLLYRACWRVGAVAAPIHHQAGAAESDALIARLRPSLTVRVGDLPLPSGTPVEASASVAEPDDIAVVLFTSGSSGVPKGVRHSHRALAGKAAAMVGVHGLGPNDVSLMPLPMAHVSGLLNGLLVPAAAGMATVLMSRWDADEALELIERERVSFMVGPPTLFTSLLEAPGFAPERVESLRVISTGAMGVSSEFVERAAAGLGAFVKRSYGATEIPTITTTACGDPVERASTTDGRLTSEGGELRIVDVATGADVAPGEAGEVWFRGPELFVGYLDADVDAEATDEVMADGWFRTGDLGVLDDEGWLRIVGRCKDVIIRGGENIAPAEVEAVLVEHPAVRAAVVLGEADERLGERVVAFVVADAGFDLDECRRWFIERGVARFKVPERVLVLDEIPTLPAGKPDVAALRERLAATEGDR